MALATRPSLRLHTIVEGLNCIAAIDDAPERGAQNGNAVTATRERGVILSEAKDLDPASHSYLGEILRCAQDDNQKVT